jgi:hypothetical protein
MNTAYCVLTNTDLLREITKWHILKYMAFPDIFIGIITNDKSIYQMKFLLRDKFVTLESLFKMLKPQLDHHNDYYKNLNIKSPVKISSFIEYLFWKEDSFELFKYIFNNYENERNKILNLDILKSSPLKTIMKCANFNQKDIWVKKINLIMVYKELDMSEPVFQGSVNTMSPPIFHQDGSLIIQPEGYAGNETSRNFDIICDAPDRNCGKTIKNFSHMLKYIPLENIEATHPPNILLNNGGMRTMHMPFNGQIYNGDDDDWDDVMPMTFNGGQENDGIMHVTLNGQIFNDDQENDDGLDFQLYPGNQDDDNDGPNLFMN